MWVHHLLKGQYISCPAKMIVHLSHRKTGPKTQLMISREIINRIIIIAFMVLVGFCFAKAIYNRSFMGIVLALVSLGAAVYFLYLLVKAKEDMTSCRTGSETEERV